MNSAMPLARAARGRPSKAAAGDIERRILDTAWDTFLALGYEAATMEQLAERAGVSKTTLYARHPDKLALLRAAVRARIARWRATSDVSDPVYGETLEERLLHRAEQVLKWSGHPEVRATARLVHGTSGEAATIARELDLTMREPTLVDLAEDIAAYSAREGREVANPDEIARIFIGMLESLAAPQMRGEYDPSRNTALARMVIDILMHGRAAWAPVGDGLA